MRSLLLTLSTLAAISVLQAAPQTPATTSPSSALVAIPVTVTDAADQLVTGLSADRFKLYVDDRLQPIVHVTNDERPASIAVVLGQMGGPSNYRDARQSAVRSAIARFAASMRPVDELLLQIEDRAPATFSTGREPFPAGRFRSIRAGDAAALAETIADGTQNKVIGAGRLGQLDERGTPYGLYSALTLLERTPSRKIVLFFNSGMEQLSRFNLGNEGLDGYSALAAARKAHVEIYAAGVLPTEGAYLLSGREEDRPDPTAVKKLAGDTGGLSAEAHSTDALLQSVDRFAREIRGAYTLSFESPARDKKFHKIRVELVNTPGSVRTRPGYTAAAR